MSVSPNRNRLIARLHLMKKEQGLDDELYRDKLEQLTGKRSAADLTDQELEETVPRFRYGGVAASASRLPATKQARLIQAQWISLWNLGLVSDPKDGAILAFIKRQTKLDAGQWLKRHDDVAKVAEALKDWMAREAQVDWTVKRGDPPFMRLPDFKVCVAQWRIIQRKGGGVLHAGNDFYDFAAAIMATRDFEVWTNPQWARVSKALGKLVRAALKDGKARAA